MSSTTDVRSEAGFSLAEMLVVVALIGVISAMVIPVTRDMITRAKADSASEVALRAISAARNRAVSERRNMLMTFITPNRLRLERQEVDANGAITGLTLISETALEGAQEFLRFSPMADTPDAFGGTLGAAVHFAGIPPVMFTTDGSLVDSAGDVVNGSVFLGEPNKRPTARAITILGISGLVRKWKWSGTQWQE